MKRTKEMKIARETDGLQSIYLIIDWLVHFFTALEMIHRFKRNKLGLQSQETKITRIQQQEDNLGNSDFLTRANIEYSHFIVYTVVHFINRWYARI